MANTYSKEVEVVNLLGIHARPSARIMNLANELKAVNVFITDTRNPAEKIDATNVLFIMTMGSPLGSILIVSTEDDNMHAVVDALVDLIKSGFGEQCRET